MKKYHDKYIFKVSKKSILKKKKKYIQILIKFKILLNFIICFKFNLISLMLSEPCL